MERSENLPAEDSFLVELRETGECRIPFRREGQEEQPFVDLMDRAAENVRQLANQQGLNLNTICSYAEDIGHHLVVRDAEHPLQMGREWIKGLRAKSEREGVLVGDPEDELLSDQYPAVDDIGDDKEMELIPGFAFWRIRENSVDESLSTPYLTVKQMIVESFRFRKDNQGETWVHLRSPVDEKSTFEKAHIRISRLETGEHGIAIGGIRREGE